MGPRGGLVPTIKYKHIKAWVLAQYTVCDTNCEAVLNRARETVSCRRVFGILADLNT